jgi:hypothetical protein
VTDDELLLNTAISFPIAFASAAVTGVELSFDLVRLGPVSGSLVYTLSHGVGRLPLAGGLFIDAGAAALLESHETFDLTQDQRHTLRGRLRTSVATRGWLAGMARYDSGLPVEVDDDVDQTVLRQQYGAAVVDRVDFGRGRIRPSLAIDVSGGVRLVGNAARGLRIQADATNVFNRLNVINFAGLLSGTAIAPRRSFAVQLQAAF